MLFVGLLQRAPASDVPDTVHGLVYRAQLEPS